MCTSLESMGPRSRGLVAENPRADVCGQYSVQVNIPAESGEMGVLANHVPSIEQLKPGLVEIIEESGGSKQFFRMCTAEERFIGESNSHWGIVILDF